MNNQIYIIATIVVIIILLYTKIEVNRNESYITGFWLADPKFLQKSDLKDMYMYIAPNRKGYLVMSDKNGDLISNQPIKIDYGISPTRYISAFKEIYRICSANISFQDTNFANNV